MLELLPSGVVYEGLAYAYLINYLPFNLTYKTADGKGSIVDIYKQMKRYPIEV